MSESPPAAGTRGRLLDAAEHLFAQNGFAGASVRAITAAAQADLGSVRYHFGSKGEIFGAVVRRRVEPLAEQRRLALDALQERAGAEACVLEELLEAFTAPAFELLTHPDHGQDWVRLVARARIEPEPFQTAGPSAFQAVVERYVNALHDALPHLDLVELKYRWHFFFGAQVNSLVDGVSLRALGVTTTAAHDSKGLQRRLIGFCAAGFRHC